MHKPDSEVEKESYEHGRNCGSSRPCESRQQGDQRDGHEYDEQRQYEHIYRQSEDGDAVKVDGHGQGHGQLHYAGDDHQLEAANQEAHRCRKNSPSYGFHKTTMNCRLKCYCSNVHRFACHSELR